MPTIDNTPHLQLVENITEPDENPPELRPVLDDLADAHDAEDAFSRLLAWNRSPGSLAAESYTVEKELFVGGMEVLRRMLEENFRARGVGDVGPAIKRAAEEDGEPVVLGRRRRHERNYESMFGTIRPERLGYGAPGQRSLHPLDKTLNLPERKYSYVLQEQGARRCGRGPFDEALDDLERTTAGHVPKRQLENVAVDAAQDFNAFYESRSTAARPVEESGSILVTGIDCKGVPKRKTEQEKNEPRKVRLGKGQKRTKKRMATVASVHTTEPHVRTAEEVTAHLMDPDASRPDKPRPRPENRRLWASLKQGKDGVIQQAAQEMLYRDPAGDKIAVCVMDGERALKSRAVKYLLGAFPSLILVLDIIHVVEYLWKAAYVFHEPESEAARLWVRKRLLQILNGNVSLVARGMRQSATKRTLGEKEREPVDIACNYFLKNKDRMRYNEYLAKGLPIASGAVEGACGHLVKDRMEITGATWNVDEDGAEAILRIRAVDKSGDWEEYWKFHMKQERERLYGQQWKAVA